MVPPSNAIYPVVPMTSAHQRQAVGAERKAAIERKGAMVEEGSDPVRSRWHEEFDHLHFRVSVVQVGTGLSRPASPRRR